MFATPNKKFYDTLASNFDWITPLYKWFKGAKRIVDHLGCHYPYPTGVSSDYKAKYRWTETASPPRKFNIELEKWGQKNPEYIFDMTSTSQNFYTAKKIPVRENFKPSWPQTAGVSY